MCDRGLINTGLSSVIRRYIIDVISGAGRISRRISCRGTHIVPAFEPKFAVSHRRTGWIHRPTGRYSREQKLRAVQAAIGTTIMSFAMMTPDRWSAPAPT
jgi:hypothetical protein